MPENAPKNVPKIVLGVESEDLGLSRRRSEIPPKQSLNFLICKRFAVSKTCPVIDRYGVCSCQLSRHATTKHSAPNCRWYSATLPMPLFARTGANNPNNLHDIVPVWQRVICRLCQAAQAATVQAKQRTGAAGAIFLILCSII